MTDLELYRLIKKYCFEFHKDGIFFIKSYDIGDFAKELGVTDAERGVDVTIVTDGDFAIDANNLEYYCEDIDSVIESLVEDIGEA